MKEYLTDPCSQAVLQTPVLLIKSFSQSVSQSVIIFLQCFKASFGKSTVYQFGEQDWQDMINIFPNKNKVNQKH